MQFMRPRAFILAAALAIVAIAGLPMESARAASQASAWVELMNSRIRLVRGLGPAPGVFEIGVQIQLEPGWKTYWRMPGDAGIPPEFDFSRSSNLARVDIAWPAPEWLAIGG